MSLDKDVVVSLEMQVLNLTIPWLPLPGESKNRDRWTGSIATNKEQDFCKIPGF